MSMLRNQDGVTREVGGDPMNANVAAIRTKAEAMLGEQFAALRGRLPGDARVALARAENYGKFLRSGLPNRRVEAWHFTDLRGALREALPVLEAGASLAAAPARMAGMAGVASDAVRLVLVDGFFHPEMSDLAALPDELRVRSLAQALTEADDSLIEALLPAGLAEDPATALNAALMAGGLVLEVADGAHVARPVEIVWLGAATTPGAIFARSLVRLGVGAHLTLLESGVGAAAARQINSVLIASLSDGAELDHVWASPELAPASLQVDSFLVTLGARARLSSTSFVSGVPFLRRQIFLRFDAERAEASLAGLSLLRHAEHADGTLSVSHVAPHCKSRELFKHVIDDEAAGVFQGKIVVAPGAQKTDGVMASRAILLSEDAGMDTKPELEIFADDVVCGHGATCSELDGDQLFYAMSRGLPRQQAEALLLEAFAGEALQSISNESAREALFARMRAWFDQRGC
jgi:Fe-S cluster assembly protein SufD